VHSPAPLDESARTVERSPDRVVLEDLDFELTTELPNVLHEPSSDSPTVQLGVHEQAAHFIPDDGDESRDAILSDPHPRFCRLKVYVSDVLSLPRQELI
jgi:hypothetical protein